MGFVLSLLYFGIHYLTPTFLFGSVADWHIQQIIIALAFLASIPAMLKSFLFRTPQTLGVCGLTVAVFMSEAIGNHYLTGGIQSFLDFIPSAIAYFLVGLHCTTKRRIQILTAVLFCIAAIYITNGYIDLQKGVPTSGPPPGVGMGNEETGGATPSPYFMRQMNSAGNWTYRLQGLGEVNDPNDLGQFLICLIPLLFISWRPETKIANFLLVILPASIILFGLFLTHSRSSLLALIGIIIVALRRRLGTVLAVILAGCLFLGAMALQFTGGREISANAGEDRTSLWGQGLATFRTHPLFGVGFGRLYEYTDGHLTAHNSIVLCVSELGIFGLYVWSLFLYPTLKDAAVLASPENVTEGSQIEIQNGPFPAAYRKKEPMAKNDIVRLGRAIQMSLVGFLIAGWFLSRSFALLFFLLGGLTASMYQMALDRGMVAQRIKFSRILLNSGILAIALLVLIYIVVRILNLAH